VFVDCKDLRQTSPLSQVIPAQSKAQFTLVFESNSKGKFQRSIRCCFDAFNRHWLSSAAYVQCSINDAVR